MNMHKRMAQNNASFFVYIITIICDLAQNTLFVIFIKCVLFVILCLFYFLFFNFSLTYF